MEVTGKYLLNQAESILRDRRQDSRSQSVKNSREDTARGKEKTELLKQGMFESRVMNLQDSLGRIQKEFTREQARYEYLSSNPEDINDKLMFDGEPLFPELQNHTPGSFEALKKHVEETLQRMTRDLKGTQVEMENLLALQFNNLDGLKVSSEDLTGHEGWNNLDPERVARLTRP